MTTTAALHRAAEDAGRAPSILNTQPWRWHIEHDIMHLHADLSRKVAALDPHGRLLTLSCGAALHHARVPWPPPLTNRWSSVCRTPTSRRCSRGSDSATRGRHTTTISSHT